MKCSIITLSIIAILAGCAAIQESEFERLRRELSVRPQVAAILKHYQNNRGADNKENFEMILAFCMRRQMAGPRNRYPDMADPILDTYAVSVLLGPPDEKTDDGGWLYYFNAEKNWHLELSFMDGKLFHTYYRQLISADEL